MLYMGVMCETCTTSGVAYVGTVCGNSGKTKLSINFYQPKDEIRGIYSHGQMAETMGHEVGRRTRISDIMQHQDLLDISANELIISLLLDRAQSWNAA